jgi:hypothetical protein
MSSLHQEQWSSPSELLRQALLLTASLHQLPVNHRCTSKEDMRREFPELCPQPLQWMQQELGDPHPLGAHDLDSIIQAESK